MKEGAKLCIERLEDNKVKRIVCIKCSGNVKNIWTLGKIYEFKNGCILRDDGEYSSKHRDIQDLNNKLDNVKFIELVED